MWFGGRPEAILPTLCTAVKKKGSEALPRRRWVKVNSCAGSGFPPSPTATALSLLPFPADGSCRLFDQQWGERERPTKSCLDLERVRECEESNYKRWGSSVYIYTGERVWSVQTLENILTSQRILLAQIMLKCSYRTRDLKFDERTG